MILNYKEFIFESTGGYVYVGKCTDSFDDESGDCLHDAFSDVTDFGQSWENAKEISKEKFWEMVSPGMDDKQKKYFENKEKKSEIVYAHDDEGGHGRRVLLFRRRGHSLLF